MFVSLPSLSEAPAWLDKGATTLRGRRLLEKDHESLTWRGPLSMALTMASTTVIGTMLGLLATWLVMKAGYGQSPWSILPGLVCVLLGAVASIPANAWQDRRRDTLGSRRIGLAKRLYQEHKLHPVRITTPLGILANYVAMYISLGRYDEGMLYVAGGGQIDPDAIELLKRNESAVSRYLADPVIWVHWQLYLEHDRERLQREAFIHEDSEMMLILSLDDEGLDGYVAELHAQHGPGIYRRSEHLAVIATKADALAKELTGVSRNLHTMETAAH